MILLETLLSRSWRWWTSDVLVIWAQTFFISRESCLQRGACLLWSPTFSEKRMKFEKIWRWSRICGNSSSTLLIYQRGPTHLSEKTDYFPNNINFGSWTSYTPAPFYSRVCQIRTAELSCQTLTTASAPSKMFMASALTKHTKKFTSRSGNIYLSKSQSGTKCGVGSHLANCPAAFLSYFHCGFVMKYKEHNEQYMSAE